MPDTAGLDASKRQNHDGGAKSKRSNNTPLTRGGAYRLTRGGAYRNESGELVMVKKCAFEPCGARFESVKPHAKFCSDACRMKAYRRRKKGVGG